MYPVKTAIYNLKQRFGRTITLYRPAATSIDVAAGAVTRTYDEHKLWPVIVLPKSMQRDFAYDLAFIAANKNFTYGGAYEHDSRTLLIDADDVTIIPAMNDYVTIEAQTYMVKDIELYSDQLGSPLAYVVRVSRVENFEITNPSTITVVPMGVSYE